MNGRLPWLTEGETFFPVNVVGMKPVSLVSPSIQSLLLDLLAKLLVSLTTTTTTTTILTHTHTHSVKSQGV